MTTETVIAAPLRAPYTITTPFAVALGVTDPATYRELRGKLRARLVEVTADKRTARENARRSDSTDESRSLAQGYRERARLTARALHVILAGLRGRTKDAVITEPKPSRAHPRRKDPTALTGRPAVSCHWTADACDTVLRGAGVEPAVRERFAAELRRWWGVRVSDDYLRVVLLDTLTPGQRCAQTAHVAALWGSRHPIPPRVRVHAADELQLRRLAAVLASSASEWVLWEEPEPASGGPGLTALAVCDPVGDARAMLRALPLV